MIRLNDIKGRAVLLALETYEGKNPYILQLKINSLKNKNFKLTDNQIRYVDENVDKDPIKIGKVIPITSYLGEELKKNEKLDFVPEKILIDYILADTDKTYHAIVKFTTKGESKVIYLPKTQVLEDPYFDKIDVEVDFTKYEKMDKYVLSNGTIGRKAYEHQKQGVKFLLGRKGGILAAPPGLGKTWMSIVAALESGAEKILIVCPASLKINWQREIECFCNNESVIITGKKWDSAKFVIINYDILKNFHTLKTREIDSDEFVFQSDIVDSKFDLVIIDEAHYLSDAQSIRSKVMLESCVKYGIERVWLLTGTPITNRPMNYFSLLKLVKSPIADNWAFFTKRYCDAKPVFRTMPNGSKKKIMLTNGASNLDELSIKTRNILLRQKKEDAGDMPEKTIIPIYYNLSPKQLDNYNLLWDEYLEKRRTEGKRGDIQRDLVELILLRKYIAMETIPNTIEIAENILEQDEKVIIFTNFTDEIEALKAHFGKLCVVHNGPMNESDKQKSVDKFQNNDEIKVFIGNEISAGVGITLTKSSTVIFNSFAWTPGVNEQSEDRSHRLGQKNNVTVYYQLFNNTISTTMWRVLKYKKDIIDTIMGDKDYDVNELIEYLYLEGNIEND